MKNYVDFFPDTPESFHLRVEETLISLEEREMKNVKVYSRRMIAVIAALLILALAATAVAVVQGNALRTRMNESGGETLAAQVQDVHVSAAEDDFSFTIDEILWEGEDMFVSYTVSVPEDGNVYLFSPADVKLNGEAINRDYGIDAEFFAGLFALGGEYGTGASQIMQLNVPEEIPNRTENTFEMKCVFMRSNRELAWVDDEAYGALFTEPDAYGNENQLMKSADVLYYTGDDPVPMVYLHPYPETRAVIEANEKNRLTPDDLENIGLATKAGVQEISITVQKSAAAPAVFNDVAQRVFDMDGYSIEITKLNLSHFHMNFEANIRKAGGVASEWTDAEPYAQWYFLCSADGSELGASTGWSMGGGETVLLDSGESVYRIEGHGEGIYPLENISAIYLAPGIFDENGEFVENDMNNAIKLTPIYNPNLPSITPEPTQDPAENDDLSS